MTCCKELCIILPRTERVKGQLIAAICAKLGPDSDRRLCK